MESLPIEDRMLFPLMSIDVGAKCGYINPDAKTVAFARAFSGTSNFEMQVNDHKPSYVDVLDIDISAIGPQVACPPTVGNVRPVEEASGIPVNIAGSRREHRRTHRRHLASSHAIFVNRKVHPDVRLQVVPVSRGTYSTALREGLFEILHEAGANIFPPSAGSNQAFNMGAMAEEEVMISNQARNFPGRNGHPKARHYLGSTLTVAASAIAGRITDPRCQSDLETYDTAAASRYSPASIMNAQLSRNAQNTRLPTPITGSRSQTITDGSKTGPIRP